MNIWKNDKNCKNHGWLIGVLTACVFLLLGGHMGQLTVIWQKAVMLCLECIGIG